MFTIFDLKNKQIKNCLFSATFGLEKESLRIDKNGNLAKTPHPFNNPHFERDFSENQLEIITDVFPTTEEAYNHLLKLQTKANNTLAKLPTGSEYLWCFSNPPYVNDDSDIPIANYAGERSEYRNYLAKKYGKRKMLFSGVHFNFSFGDELLKHAFDKSGYNDFSQFKNSIYLSLAEKLLEYSWLIVFLTSASPVADSSFNGGKTGKTEITKYTSLRCSHKGYWNDFTPVLDYQDIENYINSVEKYVKSGHLLSVKELYYPVRLKPFGDNTTENLKKNGINHIELRMLDVNPLSVAGFMKEDMDFLHLFIVYLMITNTQKVDQLKAIESLKNSTLIEKENALKSKALDVLNNMEKAFEGYDVKQIINYQKDKIINNNLYSKIIIQRFGNDYVKNGIILSKRYAKMTEDK